MAALLLRDRGTNDCRVAFPFAASSRPVCKKKLLSVVGDFSRILRGAIIFYAHNGVMLFLWKTCGSPLTLDLPEGGRGVQPNAGTQVSPSLASATIESDGMSAAEHLRD
jgi:hypothetical protein